MSGREGGGGGWEWDTSPPSSMGQVIERSQRWILGSLQELGLRREVIIWGLVHFMKTSFACSVEGESFFIVIVS